MKPTIQIIVSPAGDISIDAIGFNGTDCEKATRFLEQALGVVSNRVKKPEYHRWNATAIQQTIGK